MQLLFAMMVFFGILLKKMLQILIKNTFRAGKTSFQLFKVKHFILAILNEACWWKNWLTTAKQGEGSIMLRAVLSILGTDEAF